MAIGLPNLDVSLCKAFVEAVDGFHGWCTGLGFQCEENTAVVDALKQAADAMRNLNATAPHVAVMKIVTHAMAAAVAKSDGGCKVYRMKGKWAAAAPNKQAAHEANDVAIAHYDRCVEAYMTLKTSAAAFGLSLLAGEIRPLLTAYHDRKRKAAFLDFEDLLSSTLRMLKTHPEVTAALGKRFSRILVDEFQDTDPIQAEIFRLLSFDLTVGKWVPRDGAIFLVGDPKQAIYRFRGADVKTYLEMRRLLEEHDSASILQVSTNFRSTLGILKYVNSVFEVPLSTETQPGFKALDAFRDNSGTNPSIARFHVEARQYISESRDDEALAVAEMCKRMIGSYPIYDKSSKTMQPCRPSDIALLAPTGSDLWRYEAALENAGISVATQAGKGMFQRQEIHDLIAITRVIADSRDRLALGALLRGPLVGLTETELLDATHALTPNEDGKLRYIRVGMKPSEFSNPILQNVMSILRSLRVRALETTPHDILSQAVEELNVRATLKARHWQSPERALANVDRYLEMSRPFSVRGLRAFSDAMRRAWEDSERMAEGRPDGEAQSVSLITMHSAKGLEWPIVIPVNTMTDINKSSSLVVDVSARKLSMPFFGVHPADYLPAKLAAEGEDLNERIRLWYVATTRARDLLVLPVHDKPTDKHWAALVDLKLDDVPVLDLSEYPNAFDNVDDLVTNHQDPATFESQTVFVANSKQPIKWISPSLHEKSHALTESLTLDEMIVAEPETDFYAMVSGGPVRGQILHKMMEEVLTGETEDHMEALIVRAAELVTQAASSHEIEGNELHADELAASVVRTLNIPEVAALRPRLVSEIATASSSYFDGVEKAINGVIDAAEIRQDGLMGTLIDWKSDIRPEKATVENYRGQVADYLRMTGSVKGLIVFMSTGRVEEVYA